MAAATPFNGAPSTLPGEGSPITYPLLSSDVTCLPLYQGLNTWTPPDTSHVVEPTFSPADLDLLTKVRTQAKEHLAAHGITLSPELKSPIATTHWRDIYHPHRHKTTVVATPDPRLSPSYSPPTPRTDWPDWLVYTFLVGRQRKVDAAVRMLLNYVHWWVTFGVDDLLAQPGCPFGEAVAQFYPERMHGVTRDGRPLIVGTAGQISLAAYQAVDLPLDAAFIIQTYKREWMRRMCEEASARAGRRIYDLYLVTDLKGFTVAHRVGIPWVRNLSFIDKHFYPETAGGVIVINAPGFFTFIWGILKGFIDERTQEKVAFLSSAYEATLLQRVGSEHTPVEWGGSCARCNGHCLPALLTPDPLAERRRQAAVVQTLASPDHPDVVIGPRDTHAVTYALEGREGTGTEGGVERYTVWWSFRVHAKDIDFTVTFAPVGGGEKVTLVNGGRVAAGAEGDEGYVRGCVDVCVGGAEDGGEVAVVWSNAFSMWSSKTVSLQSGLKKH